MNLAIIGASGFIGSAVTRLLLDTTDYSLVLFSHRASLLSFSPEDKRRIAHVNGSVLSQSDITSALQNCDMAVYLVHLMGSGRPKHFAKDERIAADNFARAVNQNHIQRVVYVGGMGDEADTLTQHLASRSRTGQILRTAIPHLIELKTPMVIGNGGAGYEVLKTIVKHSPILPVPSWANGVTNPITVQDVARYVIASLTVTIPDTHLTVAIGGPDRLSYTQIAKRYAAFKQKRLYRLPIPLLPQSLAIKTLRLFKRHPHAITVADMLGSAGYSPTEDMTVAKRLFDIQSEPIERAFT